MRDQFYISKRRVQFLHHDFRGFCQSHLPLLVLSRCSSTGSSKGTWKSRRISWLSSSCRSSALVNCGTLGSVPSPAVTLVEELRLEKSCWLLVSELTFRFHPLAVAVLAHRCCKGPRCDRPRSFPQLWPGCSYPLPPGSAVWWLRFLSKLCSANIVLDTWVGFSVMTENTIWNPDPVFCSKLRCFSQSFVSEKC